MSVYIDRKYLLLVSSRLERFSQKKEDLFNFRCMFCGDSKKNKLKARGYVFRKNNDYFYTCHNCNISKSFGNLLKEIDVHTYRQYVMERYSFGENNHSNYEKPKFELDGPKPEEMFSRKLKIHDMEIQSIKDLPSEHYVRNYIEVERKIPKKFFNEIFYVENFKDFLDKYFPNHGKDDVPNDERIVLFYTNELGEITNIAGRALPNSNTRIRYCTVKVTDEKKIFGLHRVSKKDRIYVLEGQFDSLFLPNAVASGDSNLGGVAEYLKECETVLVYDNEPRNKDIVKQIEKSIEKKYTVCLLPEYLPGKDINEIIQKISPEELKKIVDEHSYNGLHAKLMFAVWKRC